MGEQAVPAELAEWYSDLMRLAYAALSLYREGERVNWQYERYAGLGGTVDFWRGVWLTVNDVEVITGDDRKTLAANATYFDATKGEIIVTANYLSDNDDVPPTRFVVGLSV